MATSSSSLVDASGDKTLTMCLKRVRDELACGRDMADQLRVMISEIMGGDSSSSSPPPPSSAVVMAADLLAARGLAGKVSDTFAQSILMLDDQDSRIAPAVDSPPARKLGDSGDGGKRPAQKDRRGCYKRRRSQKTYTKDTPDLFDDGYAWRKYGQKKILDSNHPRNYYRCTHKYDQICKAKKHVQQIQENPPLYRTTYDGHHTCKNLTKIRSSPHQLFNNDHDHSSSLLWNFQLQPNDFNMTGSIKQGDTMKPEITKTPSPSDFNDAYNGDYYISPDHLFDDEDHQQHLAAAFSSAGSDHGDVNSDVYSCIESTHDAMHQQMHDMINGVDSALDEFLMDGLIGLDSK